MRLIDTTRDNLVDDLPVHVEVVRQHVSKEASLHHQRSDAPLQQSSHDCGQSERHLDLEQAHEKLDVLIEKELIGSLENESHENGRAKSADDGQDLLKEISF